jgi:hypothetical protein
VESFGRLQAQMQADRLAHEQQMLSMVQAHEEGDREHRLHLARLDREEREARREAEREEREERRADRAARDSLMRMLGDLVKATIDKQMD